MERHLTAEGFKDFSPNSIAVACALAFHAILGLVWLGLGLLGRSLRDCPILEPCNGTTTAESATDIAVLVIGCLTWLAVTIAIVQLIERRGSYLPVLLAPAWAMLAIVVGLIALGATAGLDAACTASTSCGAVW
jgi:hypothetical protein